MMDPLEHLQMLKDSAAGIAPRKGDLKRIRALRFTEPGFDREKWREMCEMGWLGLRIAGRRRRLGSRRARVLRPG